MKQKLTMLVLAVLMISACTVQTQQNNQTPLLLTGETETFTPVVTDLPVVLPTSTPTRTVIPSATPSPTPQANFSFVVTSDMSYYGAPEYFDYPNFFAALLGYVKQFGAGAFMISPGDVLPAEKTDWTVRQVLGEDYLWFPIPGNHDFGYDDITFLQNYDYDRNGAAQPNIVNWGPSTCPNTTYSFDYQNAHFIGLNVYCDEESPWGIDGSITDPVYDWLAADLAGTEKEHIFVFGHEPAFPQADDQTGDIRHLNDSLDQYPEDRDRFWQLLQSHEVVAYIHGHTHGYSAEKFGGIWQLDAGQAMGVRAAPSPGTFLIITVEGETITLQTFRGEEGPGFSFLLWEEVILRP